MATYYFSRLTLKTEIDYLNKAEFLLNGINSRAEVIWRNDNYKLLNGEIIKVGSKIFVTGEMVKYKPIHEDERVNASNEAERVFIENKILARVRFFIDPEASIIAYEENRSYIPKDSFPQRFMDLFKQNYDDQVSDMTIESIADDYSFFRRIEEFAKIKKIEIRLTPSNPNNNDIWEDVDDDLKEREITAYRETQENKKKDGGIIVDDETRKKFYMSEDGYGKAKVDGYDKEGRYLVISTKDKKEHAKDQIPNDIVDINIKMEKLIKKLNELISRTTERES